MLERFQVVTTTGATNTPTAMGGAVGVSKLRICRRRLHLLTRSHNKNPKPPTHHSVANTIKTIANSEMDRVGNDGDDGGGGSGTVRSFFFKKRFFCFLKPIKPVAKSALFLRGGCRCVCSC